MIPAVIGAASVGLGAMYSVGQLRDNRKFWNDYRKNTGYVPRYAYRSGSRDFIKYGARTLGSMYGFSRVSRRPVVNRYITNRNRYYYQDYKTVNKYSDVIRYR